MLFVLSPGEAVRPVTHRQEEPIYVAANRPRGTIAYSRASVGVQAYTRSGALFTSRMMIDGEEVPAVYDRRLRRLSYRPTRAFAVGDRRVECTFELGGKRYVKNWTFRVSPDAIDRFPRRTAEHERYITALNVLRASAGLAPVVFDPSLSLAARDHAGYLEVNGQSGHRQIRGRPGFTGATIQDRTLLYGIERDLVELLTLGAGSPVSAIAGWWNSPYHRVPLLQPGVLSVGVGRAGDVHALVADQSGTGEGISPKPGQDEVPTRWSGLETPDPGRVHGGWPGMVGTPLIYSRWNHGPEPIATAYSTLAEATGRPVSCWTNQPGNDRSLTNALVLTPKIPLRRSTSYLWIVNGALTDGTAFTKRIPFRTGSK